MNQDEIESLVDFTIDGRLRKEVLIQAEPMLQYIDMPLLTNILLPVEARCFVPATILGPIEDVGRNNWSFE